MKYRYWLQLLKAVSLIDKPDKRTRTYGIGNVHRAHAKSMKGHLVLLLRINQMTRSFRRRRPQLHLLTLRNHGTIKHVRTLIDIDRTSRYGAAD